MSNRLRHIIKEEIEGVMSHGYDESEIRNAIMSKHFIHTKDGNVYCPIKVDKGYVTGVNSNYEHVEFPLKEVKLIQSAKERFGI